jgi:hypothetical protein
VSTPQNKKQTDTASEAPPPQGAHSERITVRPPFDPEAFARDSESSIPAAGGAAPASLPETVPPPAGLPRYPVELERPHEPGAFGVSGDTILSLTFAGTDLTWFELTPLARRLLALVDGTASIAGICARAGVHPIEAIAAFQALARDGIVIESFGTPG